MATVREPSQYEMETEWSYNGCDDAVGDVVWGKRESTKGGERMMGDGGLRTLLCAKHVRVCTFRCVLVWFSWLGVAEQAWRDLRKGVSGQLLMVWLLRKMRKVGGDDENESSKAYLIARG